jgi:hypothetical protein
VEKEGREKEEERKRGWRRENTNFPSFNNPC